MRRSRLIYFSAVGAVVVALVVVFAVAYSRGEVNNTVLHTATAPPSVALQTPTATQRLAWRTGDRAAIGSPVWGGTVVVHDTHTVLGLDARTGSQTWSYRRSDRTVCTAMQTAGVTVAVYEVAGNCDELTALDSGTGARLWTRTLDFDGLPLYGHPAYQVTDDTVMITSPSVIYAIQTSSGSGAGLNRWTFSHYGCTIRRAVLGSAGALISQVCRTPQCTGTLKFCGRGPQLLLRDGYANNNDDNKTNPDVITWNKIGDTDVPVSAGVLVSALNPTTHQLDTLDATKGTSRGSIRLSPAPGSMTGSSITDTTVSGGELVRIDGVSYLVRPDSSSQQWSTATPGPPAVAHDTDGAVPIDTARISVATGTGARLLDGGSGTTARSFQLTPAPAAGSTVYSLGSGFLVAAPSGTVAFR